MIFAIDHVVFAASHVEREHVARWIESHGFRSRAFSLNFPDGGVSSESWSFGSGGFVEFVVENEPGAGKKEWFSVTPRVIGLGFASDDFEADTHWQNEGGAWRMDEQHVLPDGSPLRIEAAGPHLHASPFYVFVMNRPDRRLEFEADVTAPRLKRIRLIGAEAEIWHDDLVRWLSLEGGDAAIMVGETVVEFVPSSGENVHASLVFAGDGEDAAYTLAAGSIAIETGE